MNRAERRRQRREAEKNPTYTLNANAIEQMKNMVTKQAIDGSFAVMISFASKVLENEFGFGDYMINKFLNKAMKLFVDTKNDDAKMVKIIDAMRNRALEMEDN